MSVVGSFLTTLKARCDDDGVDRLNYYYTCLLLLVLSLTISAKQYVGQPIQCWVPSHFTGAWEQYAENYCFVHNTYWMPMNRPISDDHEAQRHMQIGYYQWVPIVLAIQAFLFYMPCLLWRFVNWQTGVRLADLISMASERRVVDKSARDSVVAMISNHIQETMEIQRHCSKRVECAPFAHLINFVRKRGFYITLLYLCIKFIYLFNVIGQFFLLDLLLCPNHWLWGVTLLTDLSRGVEWQLSGRFPRVTMCDFDVRTIGSLHRHTVQCVLMINMFNEKVFLFLWWWFAFVTIVTVVNLIHWTLASVVPAYLIDFLEKYLRIIDATYSEKSVRRFALKILQRDGIFFVRMLSAHAGHAVTAQVVELLWLLGKANAAPSVQHRCATRARPKGDNQ